MIKILSTLVQLAVEVYKMEDTIVITYFTTFLMFDENSNIIQQDMCDINEYKSQALRRDDFIKLGFDIKDIDSFYFLISKNNMHLSSNPDGTTTMRGNADTWEKYKILNNNCVDVMKVREITSISKMIFQTDNSEYIKKQYLRNVSHIKEVNPGWEYKYFSEKDRIDFIYDNFGWDVLKLYLQINPLYGACRADLFRYLCIYYYGGVYLDMKSSMEKPLDTIINAEDEFITSNWHSERETPWNHFGGWGDVSHVPGGEYQQWFVIANKGNKILEKIINQVLSNINNYEFSIHGSGMNAVFALTGPCVYTRVVFNNINNYKVRFIDSALEGIIYHAIPSEKQTTNYRNQTLPVVLNTNFQKIESRHMPYMNIF